MHQWVQASPLRDAQTSSEDDVFSPTESSIKPDSFSLKQRIPSFISNDTKNSFHTVPENNSMNRKDSTSRNEPALQPMRDSRSAFFGGGPAFAIGRTPSPFRRAMALRSSQQNPPPGDMHASKSGSPKQSTQYLKLGATGLDGKSDSSSAIAYSDSVYSRTTGRRTPVSFVRNIVSGGKVLYITTSC